MRLPTFQLCFVIGVLLGCLTAHWASAEASAEPNQRPSVRALKLRGACKGKFRRGRQVARLQRAVSCRIQLAQDKQPVIFRRTGTGSSPQWEPYSGVLRQLDKYFLLVEPAEEKQTFGVEIVDDDIIDPEPLDDAIPQDFRADLENPECAVEARDYWSQRLYGYACAEDNDCAISAYATRCAAPRSLTAEDSEDSEEGEDGEDGEDEYPVPLIYKLIDHGYEHSCKFIQSLEAPCMDPNGAGFRCSAEGACVWREAPDQD